MSHPEPDFWDYEDGYQCQECHGEGTLLVCIDDMCQGQGWCMHGDGEVMCPHCNGSGNVPDTDDATDHPTTPSRRE